MVRWLDDSASESDRHVTCPNCESSIPVRRVLIASGPGGIDATLLACAACGARYFENAHAGTYEDAQPVGSAALAFYLQQNADMGGIAMRLIGLGRAPGTRYLEIGCGFGLGLDIARRALGWEVKGIDPSAFAALGRKALDLPIELRYFGPNEAAVADFDVVYASEFLEHVPAPLEVLRAIKRTLRPGGVLALTTPAAEMIQPKTSEGLLIPLLSVGGHLVIQTAESLEMLLYRAGFNNVYVSRQGAQLVAHAGAQTETGLTDRGIYRSWLRSAACAVPTESDLGLGLRARLFRELAAIGDRDAANEAWTELNGAVQARFGRDLESWCGTSHDVENARMENLVQREPLCLAGVLLLKGWLLRQSGETAEEYFAGTRGAARRLRNALHAIGSDDGDAEDVEFAAEKELIVIAAERGDPGVVDSIVALETARGGNRIPELRRRCFVSLVNHRRLEDARRLPDVVADVLEAAARMQILAHENASILFCAANAELQSSDGRVKEALTWLRALRNSLLQAFHTGQKESAFTLFWPGVDAEALALRLLDRAADAGALIDQMQAQTALLRGFPVRHTR